MAKADRFFKEDDKLDRGRFAEFLKNLILNSNANRRDDEDGAYIIGLDSPWGTGKTYFLDMFINYLKGQFSKDDEMNCENNLEVIYYNAWENDFWDNAFEPLAKEILYSDVFILDTVGNQGAEHKKELLKKIGTSLVHVGKGFVKNAALNKVEAIFGEGTRNGIESAFEAGEKGLDEALDAFLDGKKGLFPELESFLNSIDGLTSALTDYLNSFENKKTLVIIIDELDRCKPDFAIRTLEIAKHIFNVENVVFLFAVDVHQLKKTVQAVYGHIDAASYLLRFFHYYCRIPQIQLYTYIDKKIEQFNLPFSDSRENDVFTFVLSLNRLCLKLELSTRDIDTILAVYKVMLSCFLYEYKLLLAHQIYLFFIVLKYKKPEEYIDFFTNGNNSCFTDISMSKEVDLLSYFIDGLENYNNNIVKSIKDSLFNSDDFVKSSATLYNGKNILNSKSQIKNFEIKQNSQEIITISVDSDTNINIGKDFVIKIEEISKWHINGLIFLPDFKNWDMIKRMTPRKYIEYKLEMFDFTLQQEAAAEENQ